ncbi:hypothetical protein SCHPADRAFT_997290 [Schizopora paradoxa]|uniref:Uncharacterized protein n=1 Tax=Schizopora paradoxa TaxID=27342 RepID=A0A0H2RPK7_9AGAM|nr:hypothetical protein SCHPADRAFT_997290 [Schizopora paradoxa]
MNQPHDNVVDEDYWNAMAYKPRGSSNTFYNAKSTNAAMSTTNHTGQVDSRASTSLTPYEIYDARINRGEGYDTPREPFHYSSSSHHYSDLPRPSPTSVPAAIQSSRRNTNSSMWSENISEASAAMVQDASNALNRPPLSIVTDGPLVGQETSYSGSLPRNILNTPKTNSSGSSTLFWPDTPGEPPASSIPESGFGSQSGSSTMPNSSRRHKGSLDLSSRHDPLFTSIGSNDEFDSLSANRSSQYRNGSLQSSGTPRGPMPTAFLPFSSLLRDFSFTSDSSQSTVATEGDRDDRQVSASQSSGEASEQYIRQFLQERLGERKYSLFISRLYERRLNGEKAHLAKARARSRKQDLPTDEDAKNSEFSASTIDFLVKVEVVKEVLRLFVPRPNELAKSRSHEYSESPTGEVTFTRAIVLGLCGWSNTQFAYWGRRVEALSVLSKYDDKLKTLADALERKHYGDEIGQPDEQSQSSDDLVTGKGLDAIIDKVRQRTGASPFINGKHSSLDAFGTSAAVRAARSAVQRIEKGKKAEHVASPSSTATASVFPVKRSPSPISEVDRPRTNPTFSPIYRLGNYRHSPPLPSYNTGEGPHNANQGRACFNASSYTPQRIASRCSSGSSSGNSTPGEASRMTFRISDSRGSPLPQVAAISSGKSSERGQTGSKRKASDTELDSKKRRRKTS